MQALVEQVQRDHGLLRERIQRLGGEAGIARLDARLAAARAAAAAAPPPLTPPQSPGALLSFRDIVVTDMHQTVYTSDDKHF